MWSLKSGFEGAIDARQTVVVVVVKGGNEPT